MEEEEEEEEEEEDFFGCMRLLAHERQQIKRNRLMQDMLETGLWEEMTAACLVLMDMVYNYSKRILLFKCGVAGARQNLHT